MGITTGISLSDFTLDGNDEMVVDIDYDLGGVPTYSGFYINNNVLASISGNVYIEN